MCAGLRHCRVPGSPRQHVWRYLFSSLIAKLLEIGGHLHFECCQLALQLLALAAHCHQVDLCFFLEGIHIPRDVEVVVVAGDLVRAGQVGVLVYILARLHRVQDALQVALAQQVLILAVLVLAAGVDEQHFLSFFLVRNTNTAAGMPVP